MTDLVAPAPLVEVTRNGVVESVHYGHVAVANYKGEILKGAGDVNTITYPRSAMKPIQALALIESGAAKAFNLDPKHICLACASHWGEPYHIETVRDWLIMIDCTEEDLTCGHDFPINVDEMEKILAGGGKRERIYHNCSGKHAGFLTLARHLGHDLDYGNFDHPVQKTYRENLSILIDADADGLDWGIDGCTLPAPALPLGLMATAFARLSAPSVLDNAKKMAALTIFDAISQEPNYLWGTDGPGSDIVRLTRGRVIAKIGAEGYMAAADRQSGLGIALKISDGARRPVCVALIGVLEELGMLHDEEIKALDMHHRPPVANSGGEIVGELRAASKILG